MSVSNLQKPLFSGFTKSALIDYYARIAKTVLPHVRNRPLTLKRFPDGVGGFHFYQKDAPDHTPPWVKLFGVPRRRGEPKICHVLLNDLPTLIWSANLANIELHTFLAKAPHLERPTQMVFDLDPGEGADLLDCAEIAMELRKRLAGCDLETFIKVSGSHGLHLHVPINRPDASYEQTRSLAQKIARQFEQEFAVTSNMSKEKRRGKVFIDWSQNTDFKTTVAPYSIRAKSEVPYVAAPVLWSELEHACSSKNCEMLRFRPEQIEQRIQKLGDIFKPLLSLKQKLPKQWPPASTPLESYRKKRDFSKSPEPAAIMKPESHSRRFVVQKHAASHLHFDLRLEMEGGLKSWALPKGIPLKPGKPHLAIHVEDHPLDYAEFEGIIPKNQYGAGSVMVWDIGEYEVENGNPVYAFQTGKIALKLSGKKLSGNWVLFKTERQTADKEHWLIIKTGDPVPKIKAESRSALTGRTLDQITKEKSRTWGLPDLPEKEPGFLKPMQCELVEQLPEGQGWIYELKLDGYRCEAIKNGNSVRLISRNGKDFSERFSEVTKDVAGLDMESGVLDGELVALNAQGQPSFQELQNKKPEQLVFYAFDLLNLNSRSLLGVPLATRKTTLEKLLTGAKGVVRFCSNLPGSPAQIEAEIRKHSLEGVIAKRADSLYEPGKRGWLKYKTANEQEFVVGGFVPGSHGFESLLVGFYQDDLLRYAGKVLNGFTPALRTPIAKLFPPLESRRCPFSNFPKDQMRRCRWLLPELVVRVAFREWTSAGLLRHPSYVAMRADKPAEEVRREKAGEAPLITSSQAPRSRGAKDLV